MFANPQLMQKNAKQFQIKLLWMHIAQTYDLRFTTHIKV